MWTIWRSGSQWTSSVRASGWGHGRGTGQAQRARRRGPQHGAWRGRPAHTGRGPQAFTTACSSPTARAALTAARARCCCPAGTMALGMDFGACSDFEAYNEPMHIVTELLRTMQLQQIPWNRLNPFAKVCLLHAVCEHTKALMPTLRSTHAFTHRTTGNCSIGRSAMVCWRSGWCAPPRPLRPPPTQSCRPSWASWTQPQVMLSLCVCVACCYTPRF